MKYSIPKGTFDILPFETLAENQWCTSEKWRYLEETIRQVAIEYGYQEIRTPIFEKTELFVRGVGLTSDIVGKEMYTFMDKGERSMTLRPEGTAPFVRAFIENHLDQKNKIHKYCYFGPMFRYDRPQAGRYRQFHQFGVEAIGPACPEQDVEVIDLIYKIYQRLGLKDLMVMINSVGDHTSRLPFQEALKNYLFPHFASLSPESQQRFEKNPLRILDTKHPHEIELLQKAPTLSSYLSVENHEHFEKVKELLTLLKIPFMVDSRLVRGLDYYMKTVFEITSGGLGSQNSIVGGGRYDGLIAHLGGPDLPAVGFATGLERILQTMHAQGCFFPKPPHPFIYMIPIGEKASNFCFEALSLLRSHHIPAEMDLSGKRVGASLQKASDLTIDYTLVMGDEELEKGRVTLKEMKTRTTLEVEIQNLLNTLKTLWDKSHAI